MNCEAIPLSFLRKLFLVKLLLENYSNFQVPKNPKDFLGCLQKGWEKTKNNPVVFVIVISLA